MRAVWGFVLSARAWLIGFVVWLTVAAVIYDRYPDPRTSAVMGLLFTFFIGTAGFVRVLWPMRTYGNPPKMVAAARPYDLHTYTGRVGDASKTSITSFHATSMASQNPVTGDLSHQLSTSQQTTVQDNVTLLGADGSQHNVSVRGVNLSVGSGQLVSAAWAIRPGRSKGRYVMFRNHTTGENAFPGVRLWWMATGIGVFGYLACMWFGALLLAVGGYPKLAAVWFFVVPFAYVALGYWRVLRFRSGSRALGAFLDGVAATFTPQRPAQPAAPAAPILVAESPIPASVVPPPPPAVNAPASWLADPTGRHDHRFWNGMAWTDQVADAGVAALDPL